MEHQEAMTPESGGCLNRTLTRILHIRLRTADDLEMRNTLDDDVDRLVLTRNVGTFALISSLLRMAASSQLPRLHLPESLGTLSIHSSDPAGLEYFEMKT
jgi:hypothetical protein